jgi:hypothetical protein
METVHLAGINLEARKPGGENESGKQESRKKAGLLFGGQEARSEPSIFQKPTPKYHLPLPAFLIHLLLLSWIPGFQISPIRPNGRIL